PRRDRTPGRPPHAPARAPRHRPAAPRPRRPPAAGLARASGVAPNPRAHSPRAGDDTSRATLPTAGRPRVRGRAAALSGVVASVPPRPAAAARPPLAGARVDRGDHDRGGPGGDPVRFVASTYRSWRS